MITPLSVILLGFFLGLRHATDADHVIAVMTIVSRQRSLKPAAWIGVLWGVGHTLTILLVGTAIVLLNLTIPARLGLAMELAVGVMLIVLGLTNMSATVRAVSSPPPARTARPLIVGVVHGLAGSAAVVLLVLATIRDPGWAMAYLLVFGLGTLAGMVLLTTIVAVPMVYTSRTFTAASRRLQFATGVLSLGFGLVMAYQLALASGW